MDGISLESPGCLTRVRLAEPPPPLPGQVLLETHRMGVCGTDVGGYLGKMPFFTYPKIIGHELGVQVLAVGEGVTHLAPGDRCSIEPYMNCGVCFACRHGHTNCCQDNQTLGVMVDGGLCERFLLRADKVHPSALLSYDQLALVETLAIGCHAADRGRCRGGDDVLVIGAGPIGLAVIEFVRLAGARLIVMDQVPSRLEFCQRVYGVADTIRYQDPETSLARVAELTSGDRCRVVIDATGNHHSMGSALRYVAQTGTLVYVGITDQAITFPHATLHKPEIEIRASRNALGSDFSKIIRLIEQGLINTEPWITHRTSFDRMIEDFPTFTQPSSGVIKAIVEVKA